MTSTISLAFLCIAIFVLFTGQQGAKRETTLPDGSRKPSLPPALRRHYFAARQHFQRDGSDEAYAGPTSNQTSSSRPTQLTGNEYGRLKCSQVVKKCRRSPQPPSSSDQYPAEAQPAAAVSGYQQSVSQNSAATVYQQSADASAYKSEHSIGGATNSAYPSGPSTPANSYKSAANSAGIPSYQSSGQSDAYKAEQVSQSGTAYSSGKGSSAASYPSGTGTGTYQYASEIAYPSSIGSGTAYQPGKGALATYQSGTASGTAYQAGASSAGSYHSDSGASSTYQPGSGPAASYQSETASGTSYKAEANSGTSYQSGKGSGASYQSGADSAYKSDPSSGAYQSQTAQNAASSYQSGTGGATYKLDSSSAGGNYKSDTNTYQQNVGSSSYKTDSSKDSSNGYSPSITSATNSYKSEVTLAPTSTSYQQQSVVANSYQQPADQQNNYQSALNAPNKLANAGNRVEENYQKQAPSNAVAAAGENYQQQSSPAQQSYGEKTPQPPAPPPIEYQTPSTPSTADGYERRGRPLPWPNGSDREYGNNGEFGGGGSIGPGGQQFSQRGPQNQIPPQGQPPFLIGGRGREGGRERPPPNGIGILVGQAKTGHFRHIPTSNSKNIPYANEAHRYYYPPRMPLPLPTCFHNPTGYPCCNPTLNDLMVETYTELESKPKFHTCNINAIAQHLQIAAEDKFNTSFETVAAFDDFAQKIHFSGDLVCKVELGGKYMLAYATVRDAEQYLPTENTDNVVSDQVGDNQAGTVYNGGIGGTQASTIGGRKKRNIKQIYGPHLPPALNDLSRRYSIWI